jgi:hypothetical protein
LKNLYFLPGGKSGLSLGQSLTRTGKKQNDKKQGDKVKSFDEKTKAVGSHKIT